jgi:hypothetical protein
LQTYLPYIVGAIVVSIALPSIVKSVNKWQRKIKI